MKRVSGESTYYTIFLSHTHQIDRGKSDLSDSRRRARMVIPGNAILLA